MKIKFTKGLLSALLTLNLFASPFVAAQEGPNSYVNNVSNGDTIQLEPANTSGQTPALPTEGASDLEPATPGSQVQAGAESDQNPLPNTTEASARALSGQTSNELQPVISNLQQVTVANTYRISFDYSLAGLAAKSGDTFTISLPDELVTANLISFDVTQNGVVIGQAVPSGDKVVVTFNDAVTGDTNGTGSMAFNVVFKTQPSEGETVTAKVSVGTESIGITKTGTGPIPFETLVNKYNQTGSHVTKDFKLNGNWGPWMNTGKDYLSWWHISINGDATKADLSSLVISDSMGGKLVTDFSGFTNGTNAEIDYASLFNGPYLKQSFSLVRNGQVVANSSEINAVIQWDENGFTLDLTKVDPAFAVPSQDQIVLSYMTLIPFGTAEINNVASFTAAEYSTTDSDVAYWKNATGEAIYDAETTTTTDTTTTDTTTTDTTTTDTTTDTTTTVALTTTEETTPPSDGSDTTQTTTSATSIYSSTESTVISSSSVEKEIVTKVTTNKENQLPLTGEQATPYLLAIVVSLFGLAILLLRRQPR